MESEVLGQTIGQISELTHLVPIKDGFVDASEYPGGVVHRPLTYRLRLEFLLAGLTKLESRCFPTPVRRLGVIHAARWAIVDVGERPHLLFATQYDGSWHDYIKQFSDEVWPLMDMIWENCVGYAGAKDFALLSKFVRNHQVKADAFYVDATQLSVGEVRQLAERRRRELEQHVASALPSQEDIKLAGVLFKKLEDVYRSELFEPARALLLPWGKPQTQEVKVDVAYEGALVQPHVLAPLDVDCAVLFFVRFACADDARRAIERVRAEPTPRSPGDDSRTQGDKKVSVSGWNIGLSYAGLDLLEVPAAQLALLGQPFRQGMRARAAWLGDDESSYPDHGGEVHACFLAFASALGDRSALPPSDAEQLRIAIQNDFEARGQNLGSDLLAPLGVVHEAIESAFETLLHDVPVEVVSEQRLHRLVVTTPGRGPRVYEYFGFEDGQLAPSTVTPDQQNADARRALIQSNDPLLRNGTFLVLRKLEQDVAGFHQWASAQPELAEQMMGRKHHGEPLGDLSFVGDEQGKKCPFHSHVRRANPRTPESKRRELVRRGMSYLEKGGRRGLMFLAYNADLGDQFEFVQRNWIARGDAARGFREDVDPIVGGRSLAARFDVFQGEQRKSVKLSAQPFVTLRDGAYFFVPSLAALQLLTSPAAARPAIEVEPFHERPSLACEAFWREADLDLEDTARSPAHWKRLGNGVHRTQHAVFVAGADLARQVLGRDQHFSVREFGRRMGETSGRFFLGMDPVDAADSRDGDEARTYWKQRKVADLIIPMANAYGRPSPDDQAQHAEYTHHRDVAATWARGVLRAMRVLERYPDADGKLATRYELDSRLFIAAVLGKLTGVYFGVEDPIDYKLASWSRDASLNIFRECPDARTQSEGLSAGAAFRAYVAQLVELHRSGKLGHSESNERLREVVRTFQALHDEQGEPAFASSDELVSTLVGIVSGALATTASLFYQGLAAYAKQQQKRVFVLPDREPGAALLLAMKQKGLSVPDRIYRVCRNDTVLGEVPIAAGTLVVVGQGTALLESRDQQDDVTFFGHGRHHCPAARLALAIIDGAALALSELGQLTVVDADALKFSVSLTER